MLEIGQRFTTRTDERLLAVIYTLQQRTYKTGLPANAGVPLSFNKELAGMLINAIIKFYELTSRTIPAHAGVCKACSNKDAVVSGRMGQYQLQFSHDLDPGSSAAAQTIGEMTEKLKVSG